jgi:hypothetical protein
MPVCAESTSRANGRAFKGAKDKDALKRFPANQGRSDFLDRELFGGFLRD